MFKRLAWFALFIAALMMVSLFVYMINDVIDHRKKAEVCEDLGGVFYSEYYSKNRYKCGKIEVIKLN